MGSKLGKMVKIIYFIAPLFLIFNISASITDKEIKKSEAISKLHLNKLAEEARIFEIIGDGKSFSIKSTIIDKPSKKILRKSNLVSKRDKYILNFVDDNNKSLIKIGIGDPFTAYAQHLGYEESAIYSFHVGMQKIKAAIPVEFDPAQIIIEKRETLDAFVEVSKISIDLK